MTLISISMIILTLATILPLEEEIKNYSVRKINGDLKLSGKGSDALWKKAGVLSDFRYPWESELPPPTKFKALHNDAWLYCLFEVHDDNVHIFRDKNDKSEVAASSRSEIFFRIDNKLTPYYCMEIDPSGRVMDYRATHYRQFDLGWSWPAGHLIVKTERRQDGYTVELAISMASLRQLGVLKGKTLEAGLFRGDCFPKENGGADFKWISWVKPDSKTPDFHIPSSFGVLNLE
ncbi:MAG: carbohydrate-binding family 9-like protein [Cyclobacteriaceae bacterium]